MRISYGWCPRRRPGAHRRGAGWCFAEPGPPSCADVRHALRLRMILWTPERVGPRCFAACMAPTPWSSTSPHDGVALRHRGVHLDPRRARDAHCLVLGLSGFQRRPLSRCRRLRGSADRLGNVLRVGEPADAAPGLDLVVPVGGHNGTVEQVDVVLKSAGRLAGARRAREQRIRLSSSQAGPPSSDRVSGQLIEIVATRQPKSHLDNDLVFRLGAAREGQGRLPVIARRVSGGETYKAGGMCMRALARRLVVGIFATGAIFGGAFASPVAAHTSVYCGHGDSSVHPVYWYSEWTSTTYPYLQSNGDTYVYRHLHDYIHFKNEGGNWNIRQTGVKLACGLKIVTISPSVRGSIRAETDIDLGIAFVVWVEDGPPDLGLLAAANLLNTSNRTPFVLHRSDPAGAASALRAAGFEPTFRLLTERRRISGSGGLSSKKVRTPLGGQCALDVLPSARGGRAVDIEIAEPDVAARAGHRC